MKVALVYPPTCDPTAPYLAVPMLTGFLRAHGVEVLPIDANVEAWDALLRPAPLRKVRDRIERRIARLDRQPRLDHQEQLEYGTLWRARGDAHAVPSLIARAVATLRDPVRFYDPVEYAAAVATVDASLRAISAAHWPTDLDFTAYRTPFALTTPDEIARDASPARDPFDDYVTHTLAPRLLEEKPDLIGLSVCFPGQLQPAFAFALKLRKLLPGVHLTVGGPGVTQLFIRLQGKALANALGPFDSAVVFEGEHTLLSLVRALDEKRPLRHVNNLVIRDPLQGARYVPAHGMEDLRDLPSPDFEGLAVEKYFAPHLTLPYDPTRGCYWGKCTFCHYGLAEVGTASYRERTVEHVVEHLAALSQKWNTRFFYLSQDSVAPKTLVKIAEALAAANLDLRWATDLKPEKYLTPARAEILRKGGAVACALGVESGSPRVLNLIDKGAPVETVRDVIARLAGADIAVEAMCFTDFPTESRKEALETVNLLDEMRKEVSLFIVGEFGLTHGALVAQDPGKFGLRETWQLEGDELGTGLFYEESHASKSEKDHARVDAALDKLSSGWQLRRYPWAGSLSTAHTVYYYERFGRSVFKELAAERADITIGEVRSAIAGFDLAACAEAIDRERALWKQLVYVRRHVSRAAYLALAATLPSLAAHATPYDFAAGGEVARTARRPSHASSSASRHAR